jgi:Fur family peroxide stress response transcriptional regulator
MIDSLRGKGYRLTPQRVAVVRILADSQDHPSAQQIYERVKVDFPMTSLATVYKTVTVLKEIDQVLELAFSDGGSHYDGNKPYPHPHLLCLECGAIVDSDVDSIDELARKAAHRTGYQIVSHRLDFFGYCPKCQSTAASRLHTDLKEV